MTVTFIAPKRPVNRVFIHCSASDRPEDDRASVIDDWHKRRWGTGIGYHYYLRKDGTVERGRDLEKTPAAQAGHNKHTIAVCVGGHFLFTTEQFDALKRLCGEIHSELPLATFHGHREVSNKTCPVFDYRKVLGLDAKGRLT